MNYTTKVEGLAVCLWSCLFKYRYFCCCNCWYYVDSRGWLNTIIESTKAHFVSEGTHGMHEETVILPITTDR